MRSGGKVKEGRRPSYPEVLAIVLNDGSLLAGAANGELSGAARAFRLRHDQLAKFVEAGRSGSRQSPFHIG